MKRIRYFDLLRCISFCFIIFYHMVIQLHLSEICSLERITPLFANSNMHIATLGVAVFFMLSGASLVYTTKNNFDLKKYYKKRCLRILIPFYLAYLVCFLAKFVMNHSIQAIFPDKVPAWRFLFTILGMDGWISMHGIATFSLGPGEWFLGCLIVLYLVFPFLRFLMEKNAKLFFAGATCIYVLVVCFYPFSVDAHMNLLLKGYEFIIGMMFGYCRTQFSPKLKYVTIPVTLFFFLSPVAVNVHYAFKITILAVAFWISLSYLEPFLQKRKLRMIRVISDYSYEVFLVHHVIIYFLTPKAAPYLHNTGMILLLFAVEILCMAVAAFILKYLSEKCMQLLSAIL